MRKFANPSLKAVALAGLSAALLAGCAKRDHIEVGSVPDDYRTRHPIVISEDMKQFVVPVGHAAKPMTNDQKGSLTGFLRNYSDSGSGPITIAVPAGAANVHAATVAAREIADIAASLKLGTSVRHVAYSPASNQPNPPVIVSFASLSAKAGPCGRWPGDAMPDADNKQYHNFGCAYQNNLARQIANPMDLLGPRGSDSIDAANRDAVIGGYRDNSSTFTPNIQY